MNLEIKAATVEQSPSPENNHHSVS